MLCLSPRPVMGSYPDSVLPNLPVELVLPTPVLPEPVWWPEPVPYSIHTISKLSRSEVRRAGCLPLLPWLAAAASGVCFSPVTTSLSLLIKPDMIADFDGFLCCV